MRRFLLDDDPHRSRSFLALGDWVWIELFGVERPVDVFNLITGAPFRVVGVTQRKPANRLAAKAPLAYSFLGGVIYMPY